MSDEWKTLAAQIAELKRQLAAVTHERDQYKAQCELADALRNHGIARRVGFRSELAASYGIQDIAAVFVDEGPLVTFKRETK